MVGGESLEVMALIQARGGSKGIPGKNIRRLGHFPLIAYSIASCQNAKQVSRVVVSTDNRAIAETSLHYGAEVPFFRPAELATDEATDFGLFEHALEWFRNNQRYAPDLVVQVRPTSPFRPKGLIDEAIALLASDPEVDSVRTVTRSRENPYKMWKMVDGLLKPLLVDGMVEAYNLPRQALPETFWQTGHLDVIRTRTILKKQSLTGSRVLPLLVDAKYCIDIDTVQDWKRAERLVSRDGLEIDLPCGICSTIPKEPDLIVFDFDGVITDNRVLINQSGEESVICSRSDGMGLARLKAHGYNLLVLSSETNPVVTARAAKLGIECLQGIQDKGTQLRRIAERRGISLRETIYVGNDLNDLDCIKLVGCGIAVADSHPELLRQADYVLERPGGQGAVRELCDLILDRREQQKREKVFSESNLEEITCPE